MFLELIARTNPKTIDLLSAGGGGGTPSLVPEDVSAALGHCKHPMGSALLRVKVAGDKPGHLFRMWQAEVHEIQAREGWGAKSARTFDRLAAAVLEAYLNPLCKDRRCEGRGLRRATHREGSVDREGRYLMVACERCDGTGLAKPNLSMRRHKLNLRSVASYKETWASRWDFLTERLAAIEFEATMDFGKGIRQRD